MGLFSSQFANVVEWEEFREDMIFWKWSNKEIKKGSRLIIRPGQDACFLYNGRIEAVFTDDGDYDIESDIIPFLSTLKGFKFGFNSGLRAEVLFINTKEFTVKWGTKNPINIPSEKLAGGIPIRAFGTFNCKVSDYMALIDKIAGVKAQYCVEDIKERISSVLDQLLMKWIAREGKDLFNLQANAYDISNGIKYDLDMEVTKLGISITGFNIMSFNYPEDIQKMVSKVASNSMVGDNIGLYQQVSMADGMANSRNNGSSAAGDMAGMMMGMQMANQMMQNMNTNSNSTINNNSKVSAANLPNFCPNCGQKTQGANFCSNCGQRLN